MLEYASITMNTNITTPISTKEENEDLFNKYMRLTNFILSFTGLIFNLMLVILFFLIGRRQCATYFLLMFMTICDFLYCTIYVSIMLTVEQYVNLINYQIICPLSFFLTPFTFTGSILLLLICLLHFVTNYVRNYDTVLGQVGGRLSVVLVLAFIIIRSVLGSTSIELVVPDPEMPHVVYCTIDTNTPTIVAAVQKINHIFAEVTDILIYIGWIVILIICFMSYVRRKLFNSNDQSDPSSMADKPLSFASLSMMNNNNIFTRQNDTNTNSEPNIVSNIESYEMLCLTNPSTFATATEINNKQRHRDVSMIIISISLISVILYLPIMISKYLTMYRFYRDESLLTDHYSMLLQVLQHTAHLFCLSIRFVPYVIFDKRINSCMNRMIGMKCLPTERSKSLSRRGRYKLRYKYTWHCQCYRRTRVLEFNSNNDRV